MSVTKAFQRAFESARKKNWDKIYVAIDIHETMMRPTWSSERSSEFYPYCTSVIRYLSTRKDVCLILWSSSSPINNLEYQKSFSELGMDFKFINSNPEVPSTSYADFDSKFYVNVILDDKAGFDPEEDWIKLFNFFMLSTGKEIKL
jgi:hypothetical protein